MEVVGAVVGAIAIVRVSYTVSLEALRYFRDVIPNQYGSLQRSYGRSVAVLVTFFLRDTATQYERVESVVLPSENEDILAFRQAITDECNMTAVAVGQFPID